MSTPAADPTIGGDDADLTELKGRRKKSVTRRTVPAAPTTDVELPPLPDSHPTMTEALARPRSLPALHPLERTRLAVVETGGHVPGAALDADYIVSPFDATEQHTPWGCRTPITRQLWARGQHVRRDVFATYLATHPELASPVEPVPDQEMSTESPISQGAGDTAGVQGVGGNADGVADATPVPTV